MKTVIWNFRTREGSVRLGVGAPDDRLADLHGELKGCAVVAESYEEFLGLATQAISRQGGTIGDVLRQPWPSRPLVDQIRDAADEADPLKAVRMVLDAATAATDAEGNELLTGDSTRSLRAYLSDLVAGLDEHGPTFVTDLASALQSDPGALADALQAASEEPS